MRASAQAALGVALELHRVLGPQHGVQVVVGGNRGGRAGGLAGFHDGAGGQSARQCDGQDQAPRAARADVGSRATVMMRSPRGCESGRRRLQLTPARPCRVPSIDRASRGLCNSPPRSLDDLSHKRANRVRSSRPCTAFDPTPKLDARRLQPCALVLDCVRSTFAATAAVGDVWSLTATPASRRRRNQQDRSHPRRLHGEPQLR